MTDVARVVKAFLDEVERLGIPYVVGGSFASGAWGDPRQTNDLDVAVWLGAEKVDGLVAALEEEFIVHAEEVRQTLVDPEPYRSFQALHAEEIFKIDVFVPHDTPYVRSEFGRAKRVELLPGLFVLCSTAEDIVIRKLLWYEAGNRVSDRQWNDLMRVLECQAPTLDYAYLGRWAGELGIGELLEKALSERTGEPDPFA